MKRGNILKWFFPLAVMLMVYGCLDRYNPPTSTADVNYLVIEGILNSGGPTTIRLSRTSPVSENNQATAETNASVQIEGDDGSIYTLAETSLGTYAFASQVLDTTLHFRLKIKTADQKQYASDFVPVKEAPAIDTITHRLEGEDLQLYLSTHDGDNNTRYYLWKYTETWAYNSRFPSDYVFDHGNVTARPSKFDIYYCWSTANSSQILVGSTAKLEQDVISDYPLTLLNIHSARLQTKYSILVEQFALTRDAYDYWQQLKKSTETVGSIFDPQPSQSMTNIHCLSNADEPVVGFFSAGTASQKRIFIKSDDLPRVRNDTGYEPCTYDTLAIADVPSFDGFQLLITGISTRGGQLIGYTKSTPFCVDCRILGGTTVKPDFWE